MGEDFLKSHGFILGYKENDEYNEVQVKSGLLKKTYYSITEVCSSTFNSLFDHSNILGVEMFHILF